MEEDNLPALGPGVDLTKMAPLQQRRSVTFMNHFVTHTANFLNKFSNMAEDKLSQQQLEMQRIEIALNILEAKLSSIPGLDDVKGDEPTPTSQATPQTPQQTSEASAVGVEEPPAAETTPAVDPNVVLVKNDERYARFLKMVMVGVPKVAVENKMRAEGLDPDLLDTPDAPVPDGGQTAAEESDNESQSLSSDDDFSD